MSCAPPRVPPLPLQFDVALRFLHECPWRRLEQLREKVRHPDLLAYLWRATRALCALGSTFIPTMLTVLNTLEMR